MTAHRSSDTKVVSTGLRVVLGWYSLTFLKSLVYMLQSVEYDTTSYVQWVWRTSDFGRVMYRRRLERTKPVRMLLLFLYAGVAVEVLFGLICVGMGISQGSVALVLSGWAIILMYPAIWAHAVVLPMWLGRRFVLGPRYRKAIATSRDIFQNHPAPKIAILGSYGKTSMKELLVSVLGTGLRVAATPANKNVAISHAAFARTLTGDEQVIIIEYGEGAPGDIATFAHNTCPTHAIITGIAPAHLDQYKTLQAVKDDIFSILDFVPADVVYTNVDSPLVAGGAEQDIVTYGRSGALGWEVHDITSSIEGVAFTLRRDKQRLRLHSGLLGRHMIGPLSLAAALAYEYGMQPKAIEQAIGHTKPHEHRMQPYQIGGAWIIDDTYNGNIEGIRAGTELLAELPARRKLYVTPGLVDQGPETQTVHQQIGELIAAAKPDMVILMRNSVTSYIQHGLSTAGYAGTVKIENDPLHFYTHLDKIVAAGDVVLMQNDWPDNYS